MLKSALLSSVIKEVQKTLVGHGSVQSSVLMGTWVVSEEEEEVWVLGCTLPFSWGPLSTACKVQSILHSLGMEILKHVKISSGIYSVPLTYLI